ncbi:MAG: phage scaffolding protein [Clostridia bacterium]|nr:phage scaffolding protein [Clostridia bacterium]
MKRSFLEGLFKDLEAEDSVKKNIIDSIMTENGNDVNAEKTKSESLKNDLKVKEGVIEELNAKIKEAGSIDIEEIKKQAKQEGFEEGSKEVEEFKKTNALKASIKGAKDFDLVYSKLDKEKIKYERDDKGEYKVSGVDEQIKDVKEKYSFLFDDNDTQDNNSEINLGGEHTEASKDDGLKELERVMGIEEKEK